MSRYEPLLEAMSRYEKLTKNYIHLFHFIFITIHFYSIHFYSIQFSLVNQRGTLASLKLTFIYFYIRKMLNVLEVARFMSLPSEINSVTLFNNSLIPFGRNITILPTVPSSNTLLTTLLSSFIFHLSFSKYLFSIFLLFVFYYNTLCKSLATSAQLPALPAFISFIPALFQLYSGFSGF